MNAWTSGALLLVATAVAPVGARAQAGEVQVRGAAREDAQAYRQYQAQLEELLAAERRASGPPEVALPSPAVAAQEQAGLSSCKLFDPQAQALPAQSCMECHPFHRSHPVDLDYEAARLRPGSGLRPAQDVVARGVFLPDNQVRCASCHEARSRWAAHLAIPPGAKVRPSVRTDRPDTYERPVPLTPPEALPRGTSVSPKPLCVACHTVGD
jgi:hypothetical protein